MDQPSSPLSKSDTSPRGEAPPGLRKTGTLRGILSRVSSKTRIGPNSGQVAEISDPEAHQSDFVPSMPNADQVNQRYDNAVKQLGIPSQATLSIENKWKIAWNYERSHDQLGQPEDYARDLAVTASGHGDQYHIAGIAGIGSRTHAWLERFANAGGTGTVLLILQRLLLNKDPRMVAEAVADCTRALRELSRTVKGRETLEDPNHLVFILQGLQYVNILAQLSIVRLLLDLIQKTAGFVAAFYSLDSASGDGATHWQRIIALLDRENTDLRVAVVQLCDRMLLELSKPQLSHMPDRLRAVFIHCDLAAILSALLRACDDENLLRAIADFREHHPAFAIEEADPWAPERARNTAARSFKALQENLVIPGSCWEIIARILTTAVETPPSEWELVFSKGLGGAGGAQFPSLSSLDGDLNALLDAERPPPGIVSVAKEHLEQLKLKYDELSNQVERLKSQRKCEQCGGPLPKRGKKKKRRPSKSSGGSGIGGIGVGDGTGTGTGDGTGTGTGTGDGTGTGTGDGTGNGDGTGTVTGGDLAESKDPSSEGGGGGGGSRKGPRGSRRTKRAPKSPRAIGSAIGEISNPPPLVPKADSDESSSEEKPKRSVRKKRSRRPKKLLATLATTMPGSTTATTVAPLTPFTTSTSESQLDSTTAEAPTPPPPPAIDNDGTGGPPPPPPPPGSIVVPKKPTIKPRVKMRGLPWKHLTHQQVRGTLFESMDEEPIIASLPLDFLEQMFAVTLSANSQDKAADASAAPREISLLGGKRSDNINIALTKFKELAFSQIREALVQCDTEVLPLERLLLLKPLLPTADELKALEPYAEERALLAKPERFYLELAKIPRLPSRFNCLIYTLSFEEKYQTLHRTVSNVLHALRSLRTSAKLKSLVEIILALGNYLNGSTFRGGAFGFKLCTIAELMSFRSNSGKPMTEFLVSFCRDHYPDVLSWTREVEIVSLVATINTKFTTSEVAELAKGMEAVEEELENPVADLEDDGLPELLDEFHEEAEPLVSALEDLTAQMATQFDETVKFFGEDKMESEEFFGLFASWIHAFQGTERNIRLASEKQKRTGGPLVAELKAKQKSMGKNQ